MIKTKLFLSLTGTMTQVLNFNTVIYGVDSLDYLVLEMTIWVRSRSALLDLLTSSSSLSGRDSIASAARFACFLASSLVLCIPSLLPR